MEAHLGFIQSIISRMGTNSFLIKSWCVTLIAAIFALSAKESNTYFLILAYFPVPFFWYLDAYFLHQEKLFRKLYEEVADGNALIKKYSLDTLPVKKQVPTLMQVLMTRTLLLFYIPIIAIIIFAKYIMLCS